MASSISRNFGNFAKIQATVDRLNLETGPELNKVLRRRLQNDRCLYSRKAFRKPGDGWLPEGTPFRSKVVDRSKAIKSAKK